jgi:hypothetical protein
LIERDYIMRMITMLTQFLTRVLLHKRACEFPQARRELQSAYRTLLGFTPETMLQFSDVQLADIFGNDEDVKVTKCYILGSLMKEEGEILQLEGNTDMSDQLYLRSSGLLLTAFISAKNEAGPGHAEKIDQLLVGLTGAELPAHVKEKLLTYYELTGKYDKAENVLFELVETYPSWVAQGLLFYERLLEHSDDELIAGGLTRIEVGQGIEELKRYGKRLTAS